MRNEANFILKQFFSIRNILRVMLVLVFLGGFILLYAVHLLNEKVNSPGFKATIENNLAAATRSEVRIGEMHGHIGFKPWVSATNVELKLPMKQISLDVGQVEIQVDVWPLLHGDIFLSEIRIIHPRLTVRRFKDGTWPTSQPKVPQNDSSSRNFSIEKIVFEEARILIVDERRSPDPLLELDVDATLSHPMSNEIQVLGLTGRFLGMTKAGSVSASGPISPHINLPIFIKGFPLDFISSLAPDLKVMKGLLDINVLFVQESGPLSWTVTTKLRNPTWTSSQEPFPLTMQGICVSTGALSLNLDWISNGTVANLVLIAPKWNKPNFDLRLTGSKWDVSEMSAVAKMFVSTVAASINPVETGTLPWVVNGKLDLQNIQAGPVPIDSLSGNFIWDQQKLDAKQIQALVSSGSVAGQFSLWDRGPGGFQAFSTTGTIRDVEMGPIFFTFSTNPVILSGRLSADFQIAGAPSRKQLEKLNGRFHVQGQSGFFRSGSVLMDVFTKLNLTSLFKSVSSRRRSGLPYDMFSATATVQNGQLNFKEPVVIKGPGLELVYTGWMSADFESGKGTLIINALVGTSNLLGSIPGISQLILGSNGEFLPLIVDLSFKSGKVEKNFRSIKTLATPVIEILGNIIKLPASLFGKGSRQKK